MVVDGQAADGVVDLVDQQFQDVLEEGQAEGVPVGVNSACDTAAVLTKATEAVLDLEVAMDGDQSTNALGWDGVVETVLANVLTSFM